jgi:hypothetical protein
MERHDVHEEKEAEAAQLLKDFDYWVWGLD